MLKGVQLSLMIGPVIPLTPPRAVMDALAEVEVQVQDVGQSGFKISFQIDKQSPQRFAKNFKTPTLVTHGERDFRVPVTQGLEYYNTLRIKGVPTRLVFFPDEDHSILKPQNSVLWHREVFGWLEKYVGHGP